MIGKKTNMQVRGNRNSTVCRNNLFVIFEAAIRIIIIDIQRNSIARINKAVLAGIITVGAIVMAVMPATVMLSSCSSKNNQESKYELLTILGTDSLRTWSLPGRWGLSGFGRTLKPLDRERLDKLDELVTLPYFQGYRLAPDKKNTVVYDRTSAYDGINLYNSGHAPEAFAVDMTGKVLHSWRFPIKNIWPDVLRTTHSTFWRRVHWYPNGDILAIFEGYGMIKLDKNSQLLWSYRGGCHHQAFVAENGDIYVLTRTAKIIPRLHPDLPVLEDAITVLSPQGTILKDVSILESIEKSKYAYILKNLRGAGDILHTNSVRIFDGSLVHLSPFYAQGNALVSILKFNLIGIIDFDTGCMISAKIAKRDHGWRKQHDPYLLNNGNVLLFDNAGNAGGSRVLEFDMIEDKIVWQYPENGSEGLFSETCGTVQRLPNGNTFITESDSGRALEITPDGKIVWEYYNPHRTGKSEQLIATLFEMIRIDSESMPWLTADEQ